MTASHRQPIAIVGVSAIFPGSHDANGFWRDILAGKDLLTDVPATHWRIDDYYDADPSAPDKTYARRGGFLAPMDFDALGWGIPPSTIPATDTSQLLALIAARAVFEDAAREQFETIDRSRISVILGVTSAQELLFSLVSRLQRPVWQKALRETGLPEDEVQAACARIAAHYVPWQEASFPGLLGNVVAGRIANRLGLGGTNCVTDAACASSFSAIQMAVNELQLGDSDLVISGGVDTLNDIFMYMCFSKTPALSPSGDCRPFSDQADGTMLGEGLGMVALKRLADAERDGDRIYAVLRGVGTSSDGRAKSVYAPVSAGQAVALRRAYAQAGFGPETVELVEAHGTGTKAGDVAEFEGLRSVYAEADAARTQWCALGSVKSQIGHTKAAAGAAGLFKAVMALHHKVLPPTIKADVPNPKLELGTSPFYLNTSARPWIRDASHPRRAAVSAFGFGGSNFHLALEEYVGAAPRAERLATQSHDLVALSAASADAMIGQIAQWRRACAGKVALASIARDSRDAFDHTAALRLAVVASNAADLDARLDVAQKKIAADPAQSFQLPDGTSYGVGAPEGTLALLFPGQGSQYAGMGAAAAMQFDAARSVWDRAAELRVHETVFGRS
ncbi:MAG TPA: beta-ketoacyl synthase N-terminal-like domain-containing protein, partial [Tahibacter sp.]|nr:beta-ketoacyl synthase N-terminal-like domain-containing protein [Tahibacter sp.]